MQHLIQYDHHDCWERIQDVIVTYKIENFIKDCNKLLDNINNKEVSKRLKEQVNYVVDYNGESFKTRLSKCVNNLLQIYL